MRSRISEAKIEKRCKSKARRDDWWVRKFSSPANNAVPDDIFLKEGRLVFIEFKKPGNTPTELQWIEINLINEAGGEAYWCDSYELFLELLYGTDWELKMQYQREDMVYLC